MKRQLARLDDKYTKKKFQTKKALEYKSNNFDTCHCKHSAYFYKLKVTYIVRDRYIEREPL